MNCLLKNLIIAMIVSATACAADSDEASYYDDYNNSGPSNTDGVGSNNSPSYDAGNSSGVPEDPFVPEVEDEYEFSAPAVVGHSVFVANETLNSVAMIDSDTLRVQTIPVGFLPTEIAGPTNSDAGNVWVLNSGSNTVSRIDSTTLKSQTYRSLRKGNALAVAPDSKWAFVWCDLSKFEETIPAEVDLASVTALNEAGAFQLAVGFNVREVRLSEDGQYAIIVTDDGISRVELATVTGDVFSPPIPLIDAEPEDLEIVVDPSGRWAIARAATQKALTLVDLESGERTDIALPEIPTDLDWVEPAQVLVSMPRTGNHFVATVPEGLRNMAVVLGAPVIVPVMSGADAGLDAGMDAGMDIDMDAGMDTDMDAEMDTDMDAGMDTGMDAGMDTGMDAGMDTGMDAGPTEGLPVIDGVTLLHLDIPTLGAAEVAPNGNVALFFSTLNDERRGILWDFANAAQDQITFEKGIRGAVADTVGRAFVVLHSRVDQPIPVGATPLDPEYIERSWAISLLDVASGANRLILTTHEAGRSVLWSDDTGFVKLYMGFKVPADEAQRVDTQRDILIANLSTFATQTFRLASYPEGLGLVEPARRVYIAQIHPQGRMTFVDVDTDERQTVTGYELNSGID